MPPAAAGAGTSLEHRSAAEEPAGGGVEEDLVDRAVLGVPDRVHPQPLGRGVQGGQLPDGAQRAVEGGAAGRLEDRFGVDQQVADGGEEPVVLGPLVDPGVAEQQRAYGGRVGGQGGQPGRGRQDRRRPVVGELLAHLGDLGGRVAELLPPAPPWRAGRFHGVGRVGAAARGGHLLARAARVGTVAHDLERDHSLRVEPPISWSSRPIVPFSAGVPPPTFVGRRDALGVHVDQLARGERGRRGGAAGRGERLESRPGVDRRAGRGQGRHGGVAVRVAGGPNRPAPPAARPRTTAAAATGTSARRQPVPWRVGGGLPSGHGVPGAVRSSVGSGLLGGHVPYGHDVRFVAFHRSASGHLCSRAARAPWSARGGTHVRWIPRQVHGRLDRLVAGLAQLDEAPRGQIQQRRLGRVLGQGPSVAEEADQRGRLGPHRGGPVRGVPDAPVG